MAVTVATAEIQVVHFLQQAGEVQGDMLDKVDEEAAEQLQQLRD
jgi:hypothetical protein